MKILLVNRTDLSNREAFSVADRVVRDRVGTFLTSEDNISYKVQSRYRKDGTHVLTITKAVLQGWEHLPKAGGKGRVPTRAIMHQSIEKAMEELGKLRELTHSHLKEAEVEMVGKKFRILLNTIYAEQAEVI